ncbi:MAG: hypothetical protein QGG40_11240, partial [Myxococcota bacterium]|nr:hypothetical protein [Myxococcota bacterium]
MRTTSRLLRPFLPLGAVLLLAVPTGAQAGLTPALDLGLAFADGSTTSDQALRVGYTLPLPLLHVTPELGLRVVGLETEASMVAPIVGARVGFGSVIVPSLYLHGGNAKDVGLLLDGGL